MCGFAEVFLPPHKLGWKCALILKAEAEEHWCVHYTCNGTVYKPKLGFIAAFLIVKVFVLYFNAAMRKLNMCWMCRWLMDGTDHVRGPHSPFCLITLTVQLTCYSCNVLFLFTGTCGYQPAFFFPLEFDSNTPTAGGGCLKTWGGKSSYTTLYDRAELFFFLNKLVILFLLWSHPEVLYFIIAFPYVYFVWLCLMIPLVICAQRIKTVPFYAVFITSHGGWEIRRENIVNKFLSKKIFLWLYWRNVLVSGLSGSKHFTSNF